MIMRNIFALLLILTPLFAFSYTGEIASSFSAPAAYPSGLTFDGKNLWTTDFKTDKIYKLSPEGKVLKTIESPAYWPTGLAWDGSSLWCSDIKGLIPQGDEYHRGKIYKISPDDGRILHTVDAPTSSPVSIAWDGKYLWCVDDIARKLTQFDPEDGTTIREFRSPASAPQGITFDGKYLWVSDRMSDEIYMLNPVTGNVILIAKAPGKYARDLAFDGKFLWNVDLQDKKIYKLKIRDGVKYIKYNEYKSTMLYEHLFTNFGPGKILTADVHIALPVDRVNQKIETSFKTSPDAVFDTDNYGQKTARFSYGDIAPGQKRESVVEYEFTTWNVDFFIYPEEVGSKADIPADISEKYLADNAKYRINDPVITQAVKQAIGDEKNMYWQMRKIFNYLIDNMYYERVGGWNTAPTVLARGNGSCSEYSFVFISMCRAAGIPARYVGAVARRGDDRSIDDVFHRWVEVYLPSYGWIPVDPSGGDQTMPAAQARYIGHLSNRFVITTQSGGGSSTLGWNYNSNQSYTSEAKTNVAIDYWGEMKPRKK
jgi:transglutaminase-like putative cysteine protease/sugar lactone lactonase YvrE